MCASGLFDSPWVMYTVLLMESCKKEIVDKIFITYTK